MAIDKELIIKYLNRQCTIAEKELVESFLRGPEGEKALQEALSELLPDDISAFRTATPSATEDAAWTSEFRNRIGVDNMQAGRQIRGRFSIGRVSLGRVAVWAGLIILLGAGLAGVGIFRKQQGPAAAAQVAKLQMSNPRGKRSRITLSDGSVIILGPESRIFYPASFAENSREISLEGEAFFEVSKDPNRSFIVHTGDIQTQVLGTSFKVDAFPGQPVSVAVATGQVRVDQFANGKMLQSLGILEPGKKVSWDSASQAIVRTDVNAAIISGWVDYKLAFNAQSLQEIAVQLQRWYAVDIKFSNPVVARQRLTVTLAANMPLKSILEVLCSGSGFRYVMKDKNITIY